MRPRCLPQTLAFAAALLVGGRAFGDDPPPVPKARPTPPDTRTLHPTLAGQLGYSAVFGSLEEGLSQPSYTSWGGTFELELAVPVSRSFAIAAWGERGVFNRGSSLCPVCRTTSTAAGLAGVYHLLEGTPFDPWLSAGAGFRETDLKAPLPPLPGLHTIHYTGFDALRLALGGDYYPVPLIGFGPYVETTFGRFVHRSPGTIADQTGSGTFTFGARVIISPLSF